MVPSFSLKSMNTYISFGLCYRLFWLVEAIESGSVTLRTNQVVKIKHILLHKEQKDQTQL